MKKNTVAKQPPTTIQRPQKPSDTAGTNNPREKQYAAKLTTTALQAHNGATTFDGPIETQAECGSTTQHLPSMGDPESFDSPPLVIQPTTKESLAQLQEKLGSSGSERDDKDKKESTEKKDEQESKPLIEIVADCGSDTSSFLARMEELKTPADPFGGLYSKSSEGEQEEKKGGLSRPDERPPKKSDGKPVPTLTHKNLSGPSVALQSSMNRFQEYSVSGRAVALPIDRTCRAMLTIVFLGRNFQAQSGYLALLTDIDKAANAWNPAGHSLVIPINSLIPTDKRGKHDAHLLFVSQAKYNTQLKLFEMLSKSRNIKLLDENGNIVSASILLQSPRFSTSESSTQLRFSVEMQKHSDVRVATAEEKNPLRIKDRIIYVCVSSEKTGKTLPASLPSTQEHDFVLSVLNDPRVPNGAALKMSYKGKTLQYIERADHESNPSAPGIMLTRNYVKIGGRIYSYNRKSPETNPRVRVLTDIVTGNTEQFELMGIPEDRRTYDWLASQSGAISVKQRSPFNIVRESHSSLYDQDKAESHIAAYKNFAKGAHYSSTVLFFDSASYRREFGPTLPQLGKKEHVWRSIPGI